MKDRFISTDHSINYMAQIYKVNKILSEHARTFKAIVDLQFTRETTC